MKPYDALNLHGSASAIPDHGKNISISSVDQHGCSPATSQHGNNVSISTVNQAYPWLGEVVIATRVTTSGMPPRRARNVILLLVACVALMMTGFGIVIPVFARRLSELGSGVEALGLMTLSFSLAQLIVAPIMGTLADRYGRRPMILLALAAFTLVNIGYLFAPSTMAFILIRGVGGALTAGLFPAAMGFIADIVSEDKRARWIGMVMGGYGFGLIFGPLAGGVLYDGWGFAAPFLFSGALSFVALMATMIFVPETRTRELRRREALRQRRVDALVQKQTASYWTTVPKPFTVFATLLFLDFSGAFAFAFVEPRMIFYVYDVLNWSTVQFGIVVGVYGLAMVLGQTLLGQLSDRFGRKPIIILGALLNATLYFGLAYLTPFYLILLVSFVAGLGMALISPAASAFILDITEKRHLARVIGIKGSALALGGVLGPLLLVVFNGMTTAQGVFIIAGGLVLFAAALALLLLKEPSHTVEKRDTMAWEISHRRSMAAQATLRGIIMHAAYVRQPPTPLSMNGEGENG